MLINLFYLLLGVLLVVGVGFLYWYQKNEEVDENGSRTIVLTSDYYPYYYSYYPWWRSSYYWPTIGLGSALTYPSYRYYRGVGRANWRGRVGGRLPTRSGRRDGGRGRGGRGGRSSGRK